MTGDMLSGGNQQWISDNQGAAPTLGEGVPPFSLVGYAPQSCASKLARILTKSARTGSSGLGVSLKSIPHRLQLQTICPAERSTLSKRRLGGEAKLLRPSPPVGS